MIAKMADRKGATFLFMSQDENCTTIEGYLNSEKITRSNVLLDTCTDVPRHYATLSLPMLPFIRAVGKLRSVHVGETSREALTGALTRLLAR